MVTVIKFEWSALVEQGDTLGRVLTKASPHHPISRRTAVHTDSSREVSLMFGGQSPSPQYVTIR